jgi:hypothetical protein
MPAQVVDMLAFWLGVFWNSHQAVVWGAIPSCIMWIIWQERNRRISKDLEKSTVELKSILLQSMFEWGVASCDHIFSSSEEF